MRDRIRSGEINVFWRQGAENLADFFTNALPVHRHQELKLLLVHCPADPANLSLSPRARRSQAYKIAKLVATYTNNSICP